MAATENDVIWFEDLTIGDVGIVGGKNASLGEMVRELAPKGIEVPPGFATTRRRLPPLHHGERPATGRSRPPWIASPRARRRCRRRASASASRSSTANGPPTSRPRSARPTPSLPAAPARLSRRSPSAPRPRRRTCPTRASRASRRRSSTSWASAALLDACRRCYASLFTDRAIAYRQREGLRPDAGRAVGGRAEDGALRPRRVGRHVLDRHRDRASDGGAHQRGLGSRRERRAGRGEPGRVPVYKPLLARPGPRPHHREDGGREGEEDDLRRRRPDDEERPHVEEGTRELRPRRR